MKHATEYRDPDLARNLAEEIRRISRKKIRLMEVCGTHTVSIFRHGIRSLLPETIGLLSGPGCPVCVTAQGEIDAFVALAQQENGIVATFGDLIRVPGTGSSLQAQRAAGRDIRMVYASTDALAIARENPARHVVFLGVGFETTAPTVAAAILAAQAEKLENFSVFCAHKRVPPALTALLSSPAVHVDGLLLPGHVSVIIGENAYRPIVQRFGMPAVIAGFEPADLLAAILALVRQIEAGKPALENAYPRAVAPEGNLRAMALMQTVFAPADALWRGLGEIPGSGLVIREAFGAHDARRVFGIQPAEGQEPVGCACGQILTGAKAPPECPLYQKTCTPAHPVGPCMVSGEGTCAAYYRYSG
jgi:hydrogenase expression/formation protein HypD